MRRLATLAILVGASLSGVRLGAQDAPQGTIYGRVRTVGGTALRGASVEVINTQTEETRVIAAGDEGVFRISGLQVGKYRIVVRARGYQVKTAAEVELGAGSGQQLEVALRRQQPEAPLRAMVSF